MSAGFLRRFTRFDSLSDSDVALLERVMPIEKHSAGTTLVREGDYATAGTAATWLLIEGNVQVAAKAPDGGWGVRRVLGPGQFVGLLALVADIQRSATCRSTTSIVAARLDRRTLDELMRRDTGVHVRFQMMVARHLAEDLRHLTMLVAAAMRTGDTEALRDRV